MLKKLYFQGITEGLPSQSLFHRHLALTMHEKELFSNYVMVTTKTKVLVFSVKYHKKAGYHFQIIYNTPLGLWKSYLQSNFK